MMNNDKLLQIEEFKRNLNENLNRNVYLAEEKTTGENFSAIQENISNEYKNVSNNSQVAKLFSTQNIANENSNLFENSFLKQKNVNENMNNNSNFYNQNLSNNTNSSITNAKDLRDFGTNSSENNSKTEFKVDMSGMKNTIRQEADINKIVREISKKLEDALSSSAEGVY